MPLSSPLRGGQRHVARRAQTIRPMESCSATPMRRGVGIGGAVSSAPEPPSTTWRGPTRAEGWEGHVTIYAEVPAVEAALVQAESLGGQRMLGPDEIPRRHRDRSVRRSRGPPYRRRQPHLLRRGARSNSPTYEGDDIREAVLGDERHGRCVARTTDSVRLDGGCPEFRITSVAVQVTIRPPSCPHWAYGTDIRGETHASASARRTSSSTSESHRPPQPHRQYLVDRRNPRC